MSDSDPVQKTRLAIIGSGPAGYSAAIYAARALLQPVLITGIQPGGQLTITTDVENYPGFADVIQGPWLMEQMQTQARHMGTRFVEDAVASVDFQKSPFRLTLDSGDVVWAESVILATGAQAKWLGLASEERFRGYGVSACATCDGFFYRGKKVAVIGGGNTAVEEALFLTNFASDVYLIHRRDSLRAEPVLIERLKQHPKIKLIWNHVLEEVLGLSDPLRVTGISIRDVNSQVSETLDLEGVFIAIGHAPASSLCQGALQLSQDGYVIVTPGGTATSLEGVFAAGDVADPIYRQAVTAAGMGCMAALDAVRYLASKNH